MYLFKGDYIMTISKKLLIVASLALGLQLTTTAYFSATTFKTEITSILNFMDTLREEKTAVADKLVALLDKEFKNAEDKYEWTRYTLDDLDVIDMARIIETDTTLDAKMDAISAILAHKEVAKAFSIKKEAERRREEIIHVIMWVGVVGTTFAAYSYILPMMAQKTVEILS